MRILLVEDNADHRELMCRALTKYDRTWQVVGVTSGEEALRHLTGGETYNLVLLDYRLPERDGLEVLEEIRRSEAPLPVVVVTGRGDEQVAVAAMRGGAYDYVVKGEDYLQRLPVVAQRAMEAHQLAVDRKRAEEALLESEERYRRLVETAPEVIYNLSAEDGTITLLNPAFEKITGWSRAEWLGKPFMSLVHPDDVTLAMETFQHVSRGEATPLYGLRILSKSGEYLIGEFTSYPNIEKGKVTGEFGIARDITERKRVEEALRRSEARYKELWERAPVAYHVLDPDGKIAKVNQTEASMLGYQVHEMVGKSIFDFILPEQRKEAQKKFRQKIRGLSVPKAEDRIYLKKDGSQIYVVVDDVLERDAHGKVTGIRSTMTDITERKNAEETLARYISELRQLSKQLITVQEAERLRISRELHDEMGQALTMLRINIASIKESLLPGYAKGVKDRLADADALTEKLLGQIHELTLELRPHMLDDLGLVPTLRWYTERLSRRLNIQILFTQKNWKERPDSEISTALFRIIQEALTNAAKHARAKKIRILLVQKQKFIEVLIKDDGRGFDQRKIEKRPPRARGIGLFSMKERAALLNGECTIESHPGKGTRIHISIPRRKAVEKN